eukprot:TRINITY_DN216_c1_g3_i2.p1 TRINITY_DN216_c1_g3~~TRINITY_DN216_c1_g3_i2.p1  ORF type:complete len:826 (-),score=201.52 TRINITY_DN216_c1_g3_i2:1472-3949(-)
MHFASKKVYAPKQQTISQQQQQPQAPQPQLPQPQQQQPQPQAPQPTGGFFDFFQAQAPQPQAQPEANTNIISIDLGDLLNEVKLFTGDPVVCSGCDGIFNSLSKIEVDNTGERTWQCEFCDTKNIVVADDEELPRCGESFDYMLLPARENKSASSAEKLVIFCIDISGSMCVTTEIPGNVKLRGATASNSNIALVANDNPQQWLPNQSRNVTYVSRLQCVQAAIAAQIDRFAANLPRTRIGLVVFSNDVTILGDGKKTCQIITGDKLNNFEELMAIGAKFVGNEGPIGIDCISETKKVLEKKVFELVEGGSTALGPAVSAAVGMALNSPGSTIVIATDGLSNTGVGAMDSPESHALAVPFFDRLAILSKEKGITLNVIGIRGGDEMNMGVIGKLAHETMGEVDIVNPEKITENFGNILQSQLVATDVSVKLFLHKGFQPPTVDEWKKPDLGKSYAVREIGNTYNDTEITAEFHPKSAEELEKIFACNTKKELPFQVQIVYTALSGMKCIRVITRAKEITDNQDEATEDVDISLLGMHANTKAAKLAQQGDVFGAVQQNNQYTALMSRGLKTAEEKSKFASWDASNRRLWYSPQIQQQMQVQSSLSPQPQVQQQQLQQQQLQQQLNQPQEEPWYSSLSNMASNIAGINIPSIFGSASPQPTPQPVPQPQTMNRNSSIPKSFSAPQPQQQQPVTLPPQGFGIPQPQQQQPVTLPPQGFGIPQPQQQQPVTLPPQGFGIPQQQQPVTLSMPQPQQQPVSLPPQGLGMPQPQQQPVSLPPQGLGMPQPQQQQFLSPQLSPQYNDEVSNALYQHQNHRVQKRQWDGKRKF